MGSGSILVDALMTAGMVDGERFCDGKGTCLDNGSDGRWF